MFHVGRILAKCILDHIVVDVHFTIPFYKQLIGQEVVYTDLQHIDSEYYKNLCYILDNELYIVGLDNSLTFSIDVNNFGSRYIVDLCPNGKYLQINNYPNLVYLMFYIHIFI
jgi:hypothetical protein